ncbi:MAG: 4-demethylwyosine synthase TYW1 [Candidatus Aenigmarchaeota archaeon]|nr:4-demethylwyosine synthase TYW1 [Candidatus Aenigmarchaeota archaeon]
MRSQIPKEAVAKFTNAGYRVVGSHSAVSVCHWTKESLRSGRFCYKQKWYGIESHRCLEMTPALIWCGHNCQFCWRNMKFTKKGDPKPDEPAAIIDGCIEARKELIAGFGGREGTDRKKWKEAQTPTSAAISLAGEPTMYPRISDLIGEFKRRNMTSFLVTNGTRPDRLEALEHEPTNLYISLCAPDAATYKKVNRPSIANGWKKLNESLALMKSFDCRTVLRLTLVKGLNMHDVDKYAKLVRKYQPQVVEPKAFAWMGEARERLGREGVPSMDEMRAFAKQIAEKSGYEIADEDVASKVLMLRN